MAYQELLLYYDEASNAVAGRRANNHHNAEMKGAAEQFLVDALTLNPQHELEPRQALDALSSPLDIAWTLPPGSTFQSLRDTELSASIVKIQSAPSGFDIKLISDLDDGDSEAIVRHISFDGATLSIIDNTTDFALGVQSEVALERSVTFTPRPKQLELIDKILAQTLDVIGANLRAEQPALYESWRQRSETIRQLGALAAERQQQTLLTSQVHNVLLQFMAFAPHSSTAQQSAIRWLQGQEAPDCLARWTFPEDRHAPYSPSAHFSFRRVEVIPLEDRLNAFRVSLIGADSVCYLECHGPSVKLTLTNALGEHILFDNPSPASWATIEPVLHQVLGWTDPSSLGDSPPNQQCGGC